MYILQYSILKNDNFSLWRPLFTWFALTVHCEWWEKVNERLQKFCYRKKEYFMVFSIQFYIRELFQIIHWNREVFPRTKKVYSTVRFSTIEIYYKSKIPRVYFELINTYFYIGFLKYYVSFFLKVLHCNILIGCIWV